ncbi:uncharacterized protein LOC101220264 [Cucumis sativus]|uniref:DUF761 domain-containing protein n=1 Tax=Cucumis sativus TaxID=3659 RepID=A0A0A0K9H5_CUCSA|nr:uncharacterized protein LOC101220264 [Cucumis sativus]KGN44997.1 hypothetical protein Csa_015995 [Cucumis sativus]
MQNKRHNTNNVGRRAWNLLRLAMIWARKGGVFKRRFLMDLRLVPKFIKSLGHSTPRGQLHYGDHELSFDETPVFHVKMHRPASLRFHFPCITPQVVDFKYEFEGNADDDDDDVSEVCSSDDERRSLSGYDGGEEREDDDDDNEDGEDQNGIDLRAEKFIAEFYEQMKMQRQISFSQYDRSNNLNKK